MLGKVVLDVGSLGVEEKSLEFFDVLGEFFDAV